MKRLIILIILSVAILLLLSSSCTKTIEMIFTAHDDCEALKPVDDSDNFRDEYDNCMLFTEEELGSQEGCTNKCEPYCLDLNMTFKTIRTDFVGCHCYCSVTFRTAKDLTGYATHIINTLK